MMYIWSFLCACIIHITLLQSSVVVCTLLEAKSPRKTWKWHFQEWVETSPVKTSLLPGTSLKTIQAPGGSPFITNFVPLSLSAASQFVPVIKDVHKVMPALKGWSTVAVILLYFCLPRISRWEKTCFEPKNVKTYSFFLLLKNIP